MSDCSKNLLRTVPLYKVVAAALMDTHEDAGKSEESYSHWAARGLRQLERQSLHSGLRSVTLTINKSTNTATLPADFEEEKEVAFIDRHGRRVLLHPRSDIVDTKNIEDIPCEDRCEKCKQDKSICSELTVTEDTTLVTIEGEVYEQTVTKKLYPDGKYFLETRIPVLDAENGGVTFITDKKYVTELSLKPCGCIDETEENIEKIKCCCYDVYCSHFTECSPVCATEQTAGYRIFPETGLIQLDGAGSFTKVYLKYKGFLPKKNGQYQVPEIAFETLVQWTKFKSVENKRSVPLSERNWMLGLYKEARKDMDRLRGRFSLSYIIRAIGLTPKFEYEVPVLDKLASQETVTTTSTTDDCATSAQSCSTSSSSGGSSVAARPHNIATIVGVSSDAPTEGLTTYQNDKLKDSYPVEFIIVNNVIETAKMGEFSVDTSTGVITRTNQWQSGDVLVIPSIFKQTA